MIDRITKDLVICLPIWKYEKLLQCIGQVSFSSNAVSSVKTCYTVPLKQHVVRFDCLLLVSIYLLKQTHMFLWELYVIRPAPRDLCFIFLVKFTLSTEDKGSRNTVDGKEDSRPLLGVYIVHYILEKKLDLEEALESFLIHI